LRALITYLKVGYLLHLFTLVEIFFLYTIYRWLDINVWLNDGSFYLKLLLLSPFISMPFFPQFDARSRYQNYKMLRDQFYFYGFQSRIVKPFIKSRCQRDAALAAAHELGFAEDCIRYFYEKGYRWYNLFPDFVFSRPRFLLTKPFWMTTFFAKKYRAKVDDATINEFKKQQSSELVLAA
jgi:hypothetical protein